MKIFDKNEESLDSVMDLSMDLSGFKWVEYLSKYNEDFIKSYNKESDEGYFLEVEVQSTKDLHDLHNDLLVLHERMKIEKIENSVANLHDKNKYVINIRNLKQALNHGLLSKKVHIVIRFNQKTCLKLYIDEYWILFKKSNKEWLWKIIFYGNE